MTKTTIVWGEEEMDCPECEFPCSRDFVDVGVGIIHGPWGCGNCGWSEDEKYDLRSGPKFTERGYQLDQWGGATPTQRNK